MERIYIGVLGLGNIGSALVERIEESKEKIRKLFSIELLIKRIYVRDVNKKRDIGSFALRVYRRPRCRAYLVT